MFRAELGYSDKETTDFFEKNVILQNKRTIQYIRESGDYYKALGVIGEYVNITSMDDAPDEGEEFEEGMGMQL